MKYIATLNIVTLFLLGCATPVSAEVYQWVDNEGRTHYGDKAAKAAQPGRQAEKLDIEEGPAQIDQDAERSRQQLRMLQNQRNQQHEADAQTGAQLQQKQQRQQQYCKDLQDHIRNEQNVAVMFRYDDAGNRVLWTSEERIAYRERMAAANRQQCGGN